MIWETPFKFHTTAAKCIHETVMEQLEEYAKETPDKKVLISAENTSNFLTYEQLLDQVRAVEVFLDNIEFGKGDVATAYMPNNIEIVPFYLAVMGRGGIYTGIPPLFTKYEVHGRLSDNRSSVVFTTSTLLHNVLYASEQSDHSVKIIVLDGDASSPREITWSDVIRSKEEPRKQSVDIHDTAVLPYSSGTTGLAKGVMLSHYNLLSTVLNYIAHAIHHVPHPVGTNSIWNCVQVLSFPCFHISGTFITLTHLIAGATTVMLSKFDLRLYLETIQKFKAWNLMLSPPIVLELVKNQLVDGFAISSLGYVTCGGAPLGIELAQEFLAKFPNIKFTQLYGMSECLFPFLTLCDQRDNSAAAGCVAPGYQAKIVDLDSGRELGSNETGEVVVKGPSVMKGYLNRPEATKDAKDQEGWLNTGDVGYINDNGELFVVDRKKEMMKVGGQQVAPAEIESVLASDPRIKDVGVVGLPNPRIFEMPCAFIVRNDPELSEKDVQTLIRERLAYFKWPEGVIVFVDHIPKLPSGKILRRQLKQLIV